MLYQLIWSDKSRRDVQISARVKQFNVFCPREGKYKDFKDNLIFSYIPFTGAIESFTERYQCEHIGSGNYTTGIPIGNAYARKEEGKFTIEGFLVDGYI